MVRIRLRRVGGKKQASFRIVAADKESPRDGRFIEILGYYNPRTEPATIQLKEDRIYDWIQKGAQPSESARQVFQSAGLMERFDRLKKGEKLETLLAEADKAAEARSSDGKTQRPAPVGKPNRKTEAKAVEAAAAEAEKPAKESAAERPVAEAAPMEEVKAEATEAEAPVEEAVAEEAEPDPKPEAEVDAEKEGEAENEEKEE